MGFLNAAAQIGNFLVACQYFFAAYQGGAYLQDEGLGVRRLGRVTERPLVKTRLDAVPLTLDGKNQVGHPAAQLIRDVHAGQPRQVEVQHHQIRHFLFGQD